MARQRILNWFGNVGSPTNAQQFGPFLLGTVSKLFYVKLRATVVFPNGAITTATEFVNPVMAGVQVIAHGGTPLTLPTDEDNANFLVVEGHVPTEIAITWAPSTDTAASIVGGPLSLDWSGQRFIGANSDLYVTTGHTVTSVSTWTTMGTVEAFFT